MSLRGSVAGTVRRLSAKRMLNLTTAPEPFLYSYCLKCSYIYGSTLTLADGCTLPSVAL